jgi:hypothetical protein
MSRSELFNELATYTPTAQALDSAEIDAVSGGLLKTQYDIMYSIGYALLSAVLHVGHYQSIAEEGGAAWYQV